MQNGICIHMTSTMRNISVTLDLKSHAVLEQYIDSVRNPDSENSWWEELLNEL